MRLEPGLGDPARPPGSRLGSDSGLGNTAGIGSAVGTSTVRTPFKSGTPGINGGVGTGSGGTSPFLTSPLGTAPVSSFPATGIPSTSPVNGQQQTGAGSVLSAFRVPAGSTLAVVALFAPLRRVVRQALERRFHRARYEAEQEVAQFARRLRDELDLDALTTALCATAERTLQPTSAQVWLPARRGNA